MTKPTTSFSYHDQKLFSHKRIEILIFTKRKILPVNPRILLLFSVVLLLNNVAALTEGRERAWGRGEEEEVGPPAVNPGGKLGLGETEGGGGAVRPA